jgi:hypothetical protein
MCGCSIHIVPGGGFNIHRLVEHDPQASDSCSRESSKVEPKTKFLITTVIERNHFFVIASSLKA